MLQTVKETSHAHLNTFVNSHEYV